jgi:hypothetical protein
VFRRYPFTIILKKAGSEPVVQPLRLKLDPGSKTTGIAIVNDVSGEVVFAAELTHAQAPLLDAAAVNTTRCVLYERLQAFGLPVEWGSGGRTKYNRVTRGIEKAHWTDAACVGASTPEYLHLQGVVPLLITARGDGLRQMCRMDRFGFPRTGPKQARHVKGFQTGEIVRAVVPAGKKQGAYVGRVAVRTTGSFNLSTVHGTIEGISHRHCTALHRCDGYEYVQTRKEAAFPPVH